MTLGPDRPTGANWRHMDYLLIVAPFAITALGMTMIYSSTRTRLSLEHINRFYYVERQGIALAIGVVAMVVAMAIDYRKLRDLFPLLYIATLPLLLAVRFVGTGRNSTTAWFQLGPLQFQPSEVAKVVLVIALAGYCHQHRGDLDVWRLAITLSIALVPMALVMLQNDLGTMLVMCVVVAAVVLVAGIRPLHIATVFLVVATIVGSLAVTGKFSGYRLDRLTSFLHQGPVSTETATPAEYNLAESMSYGGSALITYFIAVGLVANVHMRRFS